METAMDGLAASPRHQPTNRQIVRPGSLSQNEERDQALFDYRSFLALILKDDPNIVELTKDTPLEDYGVNDTIIFPSDHEKMIEYVRKYLFVMAEVEAREHKIKYSTIAARRTNLTYWIYEQGLCKNPPAARLLHKETNKLLEWMSKTLDIFDFDSDAIHIN